MRPATRPMPRPCTARPMRRPCKPGLRKATLKPASRWPSVGDGSFQPGALRTFDNRRRPVPGLRYHAALRLLEAQDSLNPDTTHLWPVGSLRGFDLGEPGNPDAPHAPLPPSPGEVKARAAPAPAASSWKCSPPSTPARCCWPGSTPLPRSRRPVGQASALDPGAGSRPRRGLQ
jgi:hypothetical protein